MTGFEFFQRMAAGEIPPAPIYEAMGFDPLFESRTMWGPEDAALVLVKAVR